MKQHMHSRRGSSVSLWGCGEEHAFSIGFALSPTSY
jgi:hypothetical protein